MILITLLIPYLLSPPTLQAGNPLAPFLSPSALIRQSFTLNTGLLSNQGEKSINSYFIRVPLRKKVLKYGTPKPSCTTLMTLNYGNHGIVPNYG